ncbi:MAG: preprotein translocase subunit YajC [Sideroxydans sp.]|nr:preprotein translocase subunit YajC [Sideroxydans sp.]
MISLTELFISNAHAEGAAAAPAGGGFLEFLPLVALLAVFYFLILRPQQKRTKEHKSMMDALQKGDEVVTAGGALGRVEKVGDEYVSVAVAEGMVVQYQKFAIQTVLPKGTIKSI